jgi:hypothetical protein
MKSGTKTTVPGIPNGTKGNLDKAGFETDGYIVKKGTQSGESARFNYLPPGHDIQNQDCADIRDLPYHEITPQGFKGDGWE